MHKQLPALLSLCVLLVMGCAKVPGEFKNPSMIIKYSQKGAEDVYLLQFRSEISNENSDTILKNIEAKAVFTETYARSKKIVKFFKSIPFFKSDPLLELSFDVPRAMPFQDVNIEFEKELNSEEMNALAQFMALDIEKIKTSEEGETIRIDDAYLALDIVSFDKENILDVLEEKLYEKAK